ncbi:MAG: ComEC/Rec2 family competence protein [Clostridia bacterium]|nr:ComEC/Rec2 family competence protein [Clostridia bacterium]
MKYERRRIKAVASRKLACFAAAFSVCLWALCYGLPTGHVLLYGGAAVATSAILLWLLTDLRQTAATVTLSCLLAAFVFYVGIYGDYIAAQALDGERGTYAVELTQYPREGEYYTAIDRAVLVGEGLKTTVLIYQTGLDLQPGDLLIGEGRISLIDTDEYFFSEMAEGSFLTLRMSDLPEITRPQRMSLRYLPMHISKYVREEIIEQLLPGDEGALLASLLTGGTEGMSDALRNDLSFSGTSHITSVSGLHMAILSGAMIALFGRVWGAVAALPLMTIFGMLTGMDPPVIRSILMLAMIFLAFAVDRENDGITTVLTVLMVIAIFDPYSMVSLSLQLSFAAVIGLLLFTTPVKRTLSLCLPVRWTEKRWANWALNGMSASIAATFATLPLTVCYFEWVSILSALTNLAVLWLISVLMGLGAAVVLLWLLLPTAAGCISRVLLCPLLKLFILPISFMAELPFAAISSENRMAVALVFLWGLMLCIGYRIRPRLRLPVLILAIALTVTGIGISAAESRGELTCTVYGDGMMILSQGRKAYILLPGDEREGYIENCEDRQHDLGRLKVDGLFFSGTVDEMYADAFTARRTYMPAWENNHNEVSYGPGEEIRMGDLCMTAYGAEERYGFHIQWEDIDILYACGTTVGEEMPKGEFDLVILDDAMVGSAHGRREMFSRITPEQVIACDAEEGRNFDYLTTWNGPTQWLAADEVVTFIYEKR